MHKKWHKYKFAAFPEEKRHSPYIWSKSFSSLLHIHLVLIVNLLSRVKFHIQ